MDSKTKNSAIINGLVILVLIATGVILVELALKASASKALPAPVASPKAEMSNPKLKGLMQFSSPIFGEGTLLVTEAEYMPDGSVCVKAESGKTICVKVGTYVLIKE